VDLHLARGRGQKTPTKGLDRRHRQCRIVLDGRCVRNRPVGNNPLALLHAAPPSGRVRWIQPNARERRRQPHHYSIWRALSIRRPRGTRRPQRDCQERVCRVGPRGGARRAGTPQKTKTTQPGSALL
jgi:hypothetical protein